MSDSTTQADTSSFQVLERFGYDELGMRVAPQETFP